MSLPTLPPTAGIVSGFVPPPSVMLPPLLSMTVPEFRKIFPELFASRSALSTTLKTPLPLTPTSALELKKMSLNARIVSVAAAEPDLEMFAFTFTSKTEPSVAFPPTVSAPLIVSESTPVSTVRSPGAESAVENVTASFPPFVATVKLPVTDAIATSTLFPSICEAPLPAVIPPGSAKW